MTIDPNWVRENPEEAARQLDLLGKKYDALMCAKLEALPADLKSRYLVIRMVGDINRDEAKEVMQGFAKHSSGAAIFVNREVNFEAIDVTNHDEVKKVEQERDVLAAHLEMARQIATDWLENEQTTAATWQLARQIGKWALNDPNASLARRTYKERAEALENLLEVIPGSIEHDGCNFGCGRIAAETAALLRRLEKGGE
ncbi:hypothetical protein NDQ72_01345 [Halomonas sp. KG2]|uniref:hypothetical protein n=1 Tax=Halomonas sp. KG2 TaxID=2951138 RepID=UPI002646FD3F|nr:hypothetical protein [Halomonas sp. KG2]WKD28619.1 hypothetical protein NDQ72_01345 [Halomonas sp. KG2]